MQTPSDEPFGFYPYTTGAHMSRSMMLDELTVLLKGTREDASRPAIERAIVEENLLGKPTMSTRKLTYRHLRRAYSLDASKVLWRTLRRFANQEPQTLPLLALVLVYCRDLQLRKSFEVITDLKPGEELPAGRMLEALSEAFPGKYSKNVIGGTARHVTTTWTWTGHLMGKATKLRARPNTHWLVTTYALFAGYLAGVRGQALLDSPYAKLAGVDPVMAADHLATAGAHGLIRFRNAGGVVETDFTALLQPAEQLMLHGAH